jgi:hypothetical protein
VPSACLATVFGKHIYCFLYRIYDPESGEPENVVFCWDGQRWWPYLPSVALQQISTVEIESTILAYGSDGTYIYPLFNTPNPALPKALYAKLYTAPSIAHQKKAWSFYALIDLYGSAPATVPFTMTIDSEAGEVPFPLQSIEGDLVPPQTLMWARSGSVQGSGYALGFSLTSTWGDFSIHDLTFGYQAYALRT